LINSPSEKIELLTEAGLDHLIIMEFTLEFAKTSSEDFVEHYLVGKLHAHTIVVGYNHYFGHNREGSFSSLYKARDLYGFQVEEIPQQEIQNETVSSTKIRRALKEGNIQRANAYLEHHFMMRARMERLPDTDDLPWQPCFWIPLSDPVKALPPAGEYAASFLKDQSFEKALVCINEKKILLYPLEIQVSGPEGEALIRFHKRLEARGGSSLPGQLDAVRELIY
jgi:FAD synthase